MYNSICFRIGSDIFTNIQRTRSLKNYYKYFIWILFPLDLQRKETGSEDHFFMEGIVLS